MGFDAVADRDDDVKIVVLDATGYPAISFLPNCQGFLDSSGTLQLVLIVNILDVKTDVLLRGLKQLGHLCLAQPDRFTLKLHLQPCFAVLGLVEEDFAAGLVVVIFSHKLRPPTSRSMLQLSFSLDRWVTPFGLTHPTLFLISAFLRRTCVRFFASSTPATAADA